MEWYNSIILSFSQIIFMLTHNQGQAFEGLRQKAGQAILNMDILHAKGMEEGAAPSNVVVVVVVVGCYPGCATRSSEVRGCQKQSAKFTSNSPNNLKSGINCPLSSTTKAMGHHHPYHLGMGGWPCLCTSTVSPAEHLVTEDSASAGKPGHFWSGHVETSFQA